MTLVLNGTPANVTTPITANVSAIANNGSGACRVQTSSPHFFGSGDSVAAVTQTVRGRFQIVVIDATHFDLTGSTFAGTGIGTVTDLSLTPQVLVPTDGDPLSMQLSGLLSAQQAHLDRTQYLQAQAVAESALRAQSFPARNWQAAKASSASGGGYYRVTWNASSSGPTAQQWVGLGWSPSTWTVYFEDGTGDAVSSSGAIASATAPIDISINTNVSSAGNIAVSAINTPGAGQYVVWRTGAGGVIGSFAGITFSEVGITDCKIRWVAGVLVAAIGSSTGGAASFNTIGASTTVPLTGVSGSTVSTWILESNGSTAIAIPAVSGNVQGYSTVDGLTSSRITMAFIGATDVPVALAWSPSLQIWLLTVSEAGSATARSFWTSIDTVNWTFAGSLGNQDGVAAVTASGAYWVATTYNAGTGASHVLFSPDGGSWYGSQSFMFPAHLAPPMMCSSPTQTVIAQVAAGGFQYQIRYSVEGGTPGVVLT